MSIPPIGPSKPPQKNDNIFMKEVMSLIGKVNLFIKDHFPSAWKVISNIAQKVFRGEPQVFRGEPPKTSLSAEDQMRERVGEPLENRSQKKTFDASMRAFKERLPKSIPLDKNGLPVIDDSQRHFVADDTFDGKGYIVEEDSPDNVSKEIEAFFTEIEEDEDKRNVEKKEPEPWDL